MNQLSHNFAKKKPQSVLITSNYWKLVSTEESLSDRRLLLDAGDW